MHKEGDREGGGLEGVVSYRIFKVKYTQSRWWGEGELLGMYKDVE